MWDDPRRVKRAEMPRVRNEGRTLTGGRGEWLTDRDEGCCSLFGTVVGGTQEVKPSGGQRPIDTPGQESGRVCVCVRPVIFDGCFSLMWLIRVTTTACCIHQPCL